MVFRAYEDHRRARIFLAGLLVLSTTATAVLLHDPAFATGSTFSYTGQEQTYTVPAGVTSVTITALGAAGGSGTDIFSGKYSGAGGDGASVTATVPVSPGQVLYVEVGGQGGSPSIPPTTQAACAVDPPAFNGGGTDGEGNCGGGGGGASDVRTCAMTACPNVTPDTRLVVAGGGGGGAGGTSSSSGGNGGNAGDSTVTGAGAGGAGCDGTVVQRRRPGRTAVSVTLRAAPPVPEEPGRRVRAGAGTAAPRSTAWAVAVAVAMTAAAKVATAVPAAAAVAAGPGRATGSRGRSTPR